MTIRLAPFVLCLAVAILSSGFSLRDIPGAGTVQLTFTEHGSADITAATGTVYFEAPGVGSRQRRVMSFRAPLEIEALPIGTYRLTVVAQSLTSVLVASGVQEFSVTSGSSAVVPIDLVERKGWIRVVDAAGAPVGGAHYYTSPSSMNSTADEDGRINLAMMATGTALTVRTIQWGMTCHRVTAGSSQTIAVPDATEGLVIVAPTTPVSGLPQRRVIVPSSVLTGAVVAGLPGADCAVPYEHFPVTLARAGGMTEHTMLLPLGDYTIRLLDGRTLKAQAPGRIDLQ